MRRARTARWVAACVGATLLGPASALATPSGGLGGSLQGNPQAIRVAQRVADEFARLPAYSYAERGFFQISTVPGRTPNVSYYYGYGALHAGFAWAAEHGTVALSGGRVVWWRDDLAPLGGGAVPVELVSDSQGTFVAYGTAAHHGCYVGVEGSVPFVYGEPAYSPNGRYKSASPLTSKYVWDTGQVALESDAVTGSDLISSGSVDVRPGARLAGFTISFDNAYPGGAGAAPSINLCR